jgi:NAD(P)-dependent dehydrogenase (short-subunit alcohol dehydrogenase family)
MGGGGIYIDYAASKDAIDTMTLGLAREVAEEGIRVNAVRPGPIHTEIHVHSDEPDRVDRLKDSVPMKRGGEAIEFFGNLPRQPQRHGVDSVLGSGIVGHPLVALRRGFLLHGGVFGCYRRTLRPSRGSPDLLSSLL